MTDCYHQRREGKVWKKDDEQTTRGMAPATSQPAPRTPTDRAATARAGYATIGPSIVIRGEVTGDEDLMIHGQVDGSVALGLHQVTVGDGGRVKAGITGRVITIEGTVEGDLSAKEQIILRGTARVRGDLNAPRVVLEDGASFRGLVDMGTSQSEDTQASPTDSKDEAKKQPDASGTQPSTKAAVKAEPRKSQPAEAAKPASA